MDTPSNLEWAVNSLILFWLMCPKKELNQYYTMHKFNVRLAPYLDKDFLKRVAAESEKPQSMRAVARKLDLSFYAVKKLLKYYNSQVKEQ